MSTTTPLVLAQAVFVNRKQDVQQFMPATLLSTEPDVARLLLVADQFEEVSPRGSAQQDACAWGLRMLPILPGSGNVPYEHMITNKYNPA